MPPVRIAAAGVAAVSLVLAGSAGAQRRAAPSPPPSPPRIDGTVRDPAGKPVEKAVVMARLLAGGRFERTTSTRSDAGGRFAMALPRRGDYALRVEAPGLAPYILERLAVPAAALAVTLRKGAAIEGTVRDTRGKPVAGARVEALERGWSPARPSVALDPDAGRVRATTDARGAFRLEGLGLASHVVNASARGVGGARRDGVTPGTKLDLFLTPGAGVRGTVRGPDRRPLAGATVAIEPELRGAATTAVERTDGAGSFQLWGALPGVWRVMTQGMGPRRVTMETVAEADGTFVLAGAEPGFYRVTAEAAGFAPGGLRTAAGAEPIEIVLQRAGSITGRVVDEKGTPVPVFEVSAAPVEQDERWRPAFGDGSDGRFELLDLAAGEWLVNVKARDTAEAHVPGVKVRTGMATDVGRIRLLPGAAVRGRVTDSAGSPVAGANVWTETPDRFPSYMRSGARGAFTDGRSWGPAPAACRRWPARWPPTAPSPSTASPPPAYAYCCWPPPATARSPPYRWTSAKVRRRRSISCCGTSSSAAPSRGGESPPRGCA